MKDYTDEQLILRAQKGDTDALNFLFSRYLKMVYNFSFRYVSSVTDAEDITQETFVKVWRNIKSFKQGYSFKSWLYTITKHSCLDFLKEKSALPFSAFDTVDGNMILDTVADQGKQIEDRIDQNMLANTLSSAIAKLSPKAAQAIELHYRNELNFREISEHTGDSLHTIKSRYRRALIELKKILS